MFLERCENNIIRMILMIYEVVNPSDAITFKTDYEKVAVATVILLGEGQYGLRREDGKKDYPFLLFVKGQEQINEHLKPYFNSVHEMFEYTKVHAKQIAEAFDSVVTADESWHIEYEKTLELLSDEAERQRYKDEFNDRHRSSLNNIYACAQSMKKRFEDVSRQ